MALFEQDFLTRQIQYLTQLLQQIIFKKKNQQQQEALDEIQNAFQRLTKDHPREFHQLSLEETLTLFVGDNKFEAQLALAVADLLVEEGEILREKQLSKSEKCYLQALLLYKKALREENAAVPLDINKKINQLKKRLQPTDQVKKINQLLAY